MSSLPEGCTTFSRRDLKKCCQCGKGVGHARSLMLYEISVTHCMLDPRAIQQIAGMEMMMGGNAVLADILAPTSDIGVRFPVTRLLVCDSCYLEHFLRVAAVVERDSERAPLAAGEET